MKLKLIGIKSALISIRGLSCEAANEIVARNTFRNPAWLAAKSRSVNGWVAPHIPEYLKFAWNTSLGLFMYRGSLSRRFTTDTEAQLRNVAWQDKRTTFPVKFPPLRCSLNAEQNFLLEGLPASVPFGTYLLLASTAVGKTILQAALAAKFGQRTLVVVPTDLIFRGWLADLEKLFGFTRKEIGVLKAGKWKIGETFTLATMQTLGRRTRQWDELNEAFGTIVVDEVQGVTAPTLFSFVGQSPAKYLIGATATSQSREGTENRYLRALFGKPLVTLDTYAQDTSTSLRVSEVRVVNTEFTYDYQQDNLDWADLAMAISSDEARNELIVQNVKADWLEGRVILVTTKRSEHVRVLLDMLHEAGVDNANEISGVTNVNKQYTTSLLKAVAKRSVTCLVATDSAIKTGANIPPLDSLHIAMPPANARDWEQLIGRIRRKEEKKSDAILTVYNDLRVGYLRNLFHRMAETVFRKLKLPGYEA